MKHTKFNYNITRSFVAQIRLVFTELYEHPLIRKRYLIKGEIVPLHSGRISSNKARVKNIQKRRTTMRTGSRKPSYMFPTITFTPRASREKLHERQEQKSAPMRRSIMRANGGAYSVGWSLPKLTCQGVARDPIIVWQPK